MKKPFDYYWEQIIDSFDFDKVVSTMQLFNWEWCEKRDGEFFFKVPNKESVIDEAKRICKEVYQGNSLCSSSGFTAVFLGNSLSLFFSIEEVLIE